MSDMIIVENVHKRYGDNQVLNGVSLQVPQGTICGLIGPNGSGKTVLLRCICGITPVDAGVIAVGGYQIGKQRDFAPDTGLLLEGPGFIGAYSGMKNLRYFMQLSGKGGTEDCEKAMRAVGLNPEDKKRVRKYSLGMKQRLGLAQATMEKPRLLILDEPFNALDSAGVQEMRDLFLQIKMEGATFLLTSHNAQDIAVLCDTVYQFDGGVVKEVARPGA